MKLSYHPDTDSLHIAFSETPSVDSDEIGPEVVVDFGEDGRVVGIDIDHASKTIDLKTLEAESIPLKS